MNGLQAYQASQNAFASSAGEINNNIGLFRGKTLSTIEANKSLLQQAKSATNLEAMKGLGEEFAVRAFSEYGKELTKMVDDKLTGGRILGDTEGLHSGIADKLGELKGRVSGYLGGGETEEEDEGEEFDDYGGVPDGEPPPPPTDDLPPDVDFEESKADDGEMESKEGMEGMEEEGGNDLDFGNFVDNFRSSIGLDPEEQRQEPLEAEPSEAPQRYEGKEAETGYEEPEADMGQTEPIEEGAEVAGDTAVESGVGDALEAGGGLLDATGWGALIGVPMEIGGALMEGGALYTAGKSMVHWVEQDILGEKPPVDTTALPGSKPSLAQQGLVSAPIWDSSMDMPSSSGAF